MSWIELVCSETIQFRSISDDDFGEVGTALAALGAYAEAYEKAADHLEDGPIPDTTYGAETRTVLAGLTRETATLFADLREQVLSTGELSAFENSTQLGELYSDQRLQTVVPEGPLREELAAAMAGSSCGDELQAFPWLTDLAR